jgi:CopG family nickel-responsive transcriptional regulator
MTKKTRVSISVPEDLMKEFDSLSKDIGHPTRSTAVSEAMRQFVTSKKWDFSGKGVIPGVILVTFDHHSRGINQALTDLQHDFPDVVTATLHLHLSKHTCLEVIAFRGPAQRVRALAQVLQAQKGVMELRLLTSPA